MLVEAKKSCSLEDCEQSHATVSGFAEGSPWREHADFRYVVATWADSLIRKARAETDAASRRLTLGRILADPKVEVVQKKQAADMLEQVPTAPTEPPPLPVPAPVLPARDAGLGTATLPPVSAPTRPVSTGHTTVTNATTSVPPAPPVPSPTPKATGGPSTLERAREAALRGEYSAVRSLLEARVRNGHGTTDEANLVRQACKQLGDRACSDDIRAKYPGI
jgi:hypothetical protein